VPCGRRPPDGDLDLGIEEGGEEHQALDVIELQVREEDAQHA
jgi:hypothetical protein